MGIIRLLLAVIVAGAHLIALPLDSYWRRGGTAIFAVKAFFVLSGFYMALVLDTHYRQKPVRDFYVSRALRLLPSYWFVSAATFVVAATLTGAATFSPLLNPIPAWRNLSLLAMPVPIIAYLVGSLVTLIGSDTWLWLGFSPVSGQLSVAPQYAPGATSVLTLTAIPQAWTIGVEVLFYLLAPLIARRRLPFLFGLAAFSLAFRIVAARLGFGGEPWSRALFPSELIYFLAGIIAYRGYRALERTLVDPALPKVAFGVALLVVLGTGPWVAAYGLTLAAQIVPYVVLAAAVPFVFMLTRTSAIDRLAGNLSYPVYLVQLVVFSAVERTRLVQLKALLGTGPAWFAFNLALVLLAALIVEWLVQRPVDRIRTRFGARRDRAVTPVPVT